MNTPEQQIALIQAHMVQRAIQCIERGIGDARWFPIAKDHLFNFQKYTYRFAPVKDECWLVYDSASKFYRMKPYVSAAEASKEVLQLTEEFGEPGRFIPVRMVPHEIQP